jgi:hypothetical protein
LSGAHIKKLGGIPDGGGHRILDRCEDHGAAWNSTPVIHAEKPCIVGGT